MSESMVNESIKLTIFSSIWIGDPMILWALTDRVAGKHLMGFWEAIWLFCVCYFWTAIVRYCVMLKGDFHFSHVFIRFWKVSWIRGFWNVLKWCPIVECCWIRLVESLIPEIIPCLEIRTMARRSRRACNLDHHPFAAALLAAAKVFGTNTAPRCWDSLGCNNLCKWKGAVTARFHFKKTHWEWL